MSAGSKTFPEKGGSAGLRGNYWWNAPRIEDPNNSNEDLANWITEVATKIENAHLTDRWRSLVYFRHFTGRATAAQFSYGMAKRPMAFYKYYGSFEFRAPRYNIIGELSDIYMNRLFAQPMYIAVTPERGDFKMRQLSKMLEMWVEAGLAETGFWARWGRIGLDKLCFGSGIIKPCIGLNGKISFPRVHPDELLYPNDEDEDQNTVIQRVWANREDVMDRYGTTSERKKAIERAPSAYPAFCDSSVDCRDVIPLLNGYRAPHVNGDPGRQVLAIGNIVLRDKPYTDPELPFQQFDFHQLPSGRFGQGLAEILLALNEEIDFVMGANSENVHRLGFPKWLREVNSGVNPDALGDTSGAVVDYAGVKPEQISPPPTNPQNFAYLKDLIVLSRSRAHVSEMAVKGESGGGPNASAVALEKRTQIDDANFKEIGGRDEMGVVGCVYRMIRLGAEAKPSFTLPGRNRQLIDWSEVKEAIAGAVKRPVGIEAIGMSRFPQSIGGRQEILDSMLANGTLPRRWHTRFSQVPDLDGMQDELNAKMDAVSWTLDKLFASNDYVPPSPFMDLDYAKEAVENRYELERMAGTPQSKLDDFLLWRAAVVEMIEQRDTPDAPPAAAGPAGVTGGAPAGGAPPLAPNPAAFGGDTSGANPALAPSPVQIPPTMGAPSAPPA